MSKVALFDNNGRHIMTCDRNHPSAFHLFGIPVITVWHESGIYRDRTYTCHRLDTGEFLSCDEDADNAAGWASHKLDPGD